MAKVASLIVDIAANTAQLTTDVKKIDTQLGSFEKSVSKVGTMLVRAFTVTAIVSAGKSVLDFAGRMSDLAAKTGFSAEAVEKLDLLLKQSGVSIETAATASNELSAKLATGDKSAAAALEKLGLSASALITLRPEDALIQVGDAIAGLATQGEKVAASKTLFGKGGVEMLAAMNGQLREQADALEDSGALMGGKTLAQADAFGDSLGMLGRQLLNVVASVVGPLLPALQLLGEVLSWLMGLLTPVIEFLMDWLVKGLTAATSAILKFLANIMEAAGSIPLLGKHLGFTADAAETLRQKAEEVDEFLVGLFTDVPRQAAPLPPAIDRVTTSFENMGDGAEDAAARTETATVELIETLDGKWRETFEHQQRLLEEKDASAEDYLQMELRRIEAEGDTFADEMAFKKQTLEDYEALNRTIANEIGMAQMEAATKTSTSWRTALDDLGGAFAELAQIAGDSLSGLVRGVGSMISAIGLADKSVGNLKTGFSQFKSGDILSGITSVVSGIGGIVSAAQVAYGAVKALINAFRGGEEGTQVNPARDEFLSQFGNVGTGGPHEETGHFKLAALLTSLGAGDGGGSLMDALNKADTMAKFNAAIENIQAFLRDNGVPGFLTGTPNLGFMDFGSGMFARLHGREAVVPEGRAQDFAAQHVDLSGLERQIARLFRELPRLVARQNADTLSKAFGRA